MGSKLSCNPWEGRVTLDCEAPAFLLGLDDNPVAGCEDGIICLPIAENASGCSGGMTGLSNRVEAGSAGFFC